VCKTVFLNAVVSQYLSSGLYGNCQVEGASAEELAVVAGESAVVAGESAVVAGESALLWSILQGPTGQRCNGQCCKL